jgi:hypothetical protein
VRIKNHNFKINDNFNVSFHVDKPLILDNDGIFNASRGTFELFISPTTDYFNDPSDRYLLDMQNANNRFSLYRSIDGNLTLYVKNLTTIFSTNDVLETTITAPIIWNKSTWHKVKVVWDFNQNILLMFVDGYLYGDFTQSINGSNVYSQTVNASASQTTMNTIVIKDQFDTLFIGSDVNSSNVANVLIDNLKISLAPAPMYKPYGELLDPSFSNNINNIVPVVEDAYTSYILSSNNISYVKKDSFAIVQSQYGGKHDFSMTIADTKHMVKNDKKVRTTMEKIIMALKPVSSRVFFKYVD